MLRILVFPRLGCSWMDLLTCCIIRTSNPPVKLNMRRMGESHSRFQGQFLKQSTIASNAALALKRRSSVAASANATAFLSTKTQILTTQHCRNWGKAASKYCIEIRSVFSIIRWPMLSRMATLTTTLARTLIRMAICTRLLGLEAILRLCIRKSWMGRRSEFS